MKKTIIIVLCILGFITCNETKNQSAGVGREQAKGKLFVIGGGKRPEAMIKRLVQESSVSDGGYLIILPMSSAEPDSSVYYARKQFDALGLQDKVFGMNIHGDSVSEAQIDSLKKAALIYISGGDQNRFMSAIEGSQIQSAIQEAYHSGATIAGTSAGAAMMSEVMITGDERRYPEYSSTFQNIESDNIVTDQGLGLIKSAIIDQHFVKRSRYNRLLSAAIEYPALLGIGIDESTAVLVSGDSAEVVGESQVVLFRNQGEKPSENGSKIGIRDLRVDILLPGEKFSLKR
ncbi:cyanophycinase [Reichenbachiella ulvae]|uniref:Cyanophycinase n=1 Tax=Reichenbachiella ulvae TaxID=2980104 RepID=A0ABT3CNI1_9BACT|nr:cyanophycinase [Reichenbachiella ulvae]MCV9385301.1 cyanophycinase [Reichenbachiella ulvae]